MHILLHFVVEQRNSRCLGNLSFESHQNYQIIFIYSLHFYGTLKSPKGSFFLLRAFHFIFSHNRERYFVNSAYKQAILATETLCNLHTGQRTLCTAPRNDIIHATGTSRLIWCNIVQSLRTWLLIKASNTKPKLRSATKSEDQSYYSMMFLTHYNSALC
jgi:hypothetical protein